MPFGDGLDSIFYPISLIGVAKWVIEKTACATTSNFFFYSKFEEIYPPEVKDMVYITDDSYTREQVLRMEKIVLRVIDFNLSTPTAQTFASMLIDSLELSDKAASLTW